MNLPGLSPPADLPAADARLPGLVVRMLLALVGVALTWVIYPASGWIVLGVLLSVLAAVVPQYLLGWLLIMFLAIGELSRSASLHWQLLVLLAGVHLLHILAMLALELPWRSWVQAAVLLAPLRRFIAIQIPSQLVAVLALLLLAPDHHGHRPLTVAAFGVIGGLALAGLAVLMLGAGTGRRSGVPG